jgi:hypothetical protein
VATTLDSTYPHVVLVNPAGVAELEDLREKLRAAVETKWLTYHHEVKVENEAVLFCFKNSYAANMFEVYCRQNHIPCRR